MWKVQSTGIWHKIKDKLGDKPLNQSWCIHYSGMEIKILGFNDLEKWNNWHLLNP